MGETHRPRQRAPTTAEQRRARDTVVGSDERSPGHDTGERPPGHGVHGGRRQALPLRQRWENPRETCRDHGLPGPGRTDHQHVMATGRGDLRRQPGLRLAHDIREDDEQAANGPVPRRRMDLLDEHLE